MVTTYSQIIILNHYNNRNASAFATTGKPTKNPVSSKNNNNKGKSKEPTRDCDYCTDYHPDFPNKKHWRSACPNIEKLIAERHGHNIQTDNNAQPLQQQPLQQSQHIRSNQNVGLGLRQQVDNTAGGGRNSNYHIIASYNNMSMLESYSNRMKVHKN